MRAALLLLAGCSEVFGLHAPSRSADARTDGPIDASAGGCVTQADCPTSVCLPDGTCAAEDDVAWLDGNAPDVGSAPCTMAQPCARVSDALALDKPYWRVRNTVTQLTGISKDVTIFGEPGAGFGMSGMSVSISANVTIRDLAFTQTCLQVTSSGALTLHDVIVDGCNQYGVQSNGVLTIDRSTIRNNRTAGIVIQSGSNARFSITNSFIVGNGMQQQSQFGGVGILSFTIDPTSRLDFNTIADNSAKASGSASGGIVCAVSTFDAKANMIAHNDINGDPTATNANFSGTCAHTGSIIQTDFAGLALASPTMGDYHLTAGSSAIDAMDAGATLDHDIDGESRPNGAGYDVGADELH